MNTDHLVNRASALARLWATSASSGRPHRTSQQLARLVADPAGLSFAADVVDQVARPEDSAAAASALSSLPTRGATFLNGLDRALLGAGKALAPYLPTVVVPAARARLRSMVGHLLIDADERALTHHITSTLARGYRLNLNLLGEAVLGEREARAHTTAVVELLKRVDVDYVSVKVSSLVSQINPWDLEGETERVADRLRAVFAQAQETTPHKFVNLDMEKYQDLPLTIAVFEQLLSEPEFMHLSAGIALQAYLPDAHEALTRLIDFATRRVRAGGAPIKVRLVKGANLALERVEAEMNGWLQAPYTNKLDVDANYLRLTDTALRPEVAYALRLGLASHNLFHIAYAHLLAQDRGVEAALDVEMLHGMAPAEVAAIQEEISNPVVLYTPVAEKGSFDVAITYLVRRLQEVAAAGNYLYDASRGDLDSQEQAFLAAAAHEAPAVPRRSHARAPIGEHFTNTPDSDPALARTRALMRAALAAELPPLTLPTVEGEEGVGAVVETAARAASEWAKRPAAQRAALLRTIAQELENRREELIGVMAGEAGKTIGEADPEISEAIDFARYYAQEALELERVAHEEGMTFTPDSVVVVAPPWNFPLAIALGGVCAALAAGAAVILKPSSRTPLSAQVGMEAVNAALQAHGYTEELAQTVRATGEGTGHALVSHPLVDTVLLTGSYSTAQLFTSWRAGLPRGPRVFAETSGKNSLIVTPSADYDAAVADAVHSAFSHAGQKCSAASLLILVGSAASSERLRRQLIDAVESLQVDWPDNPSAKVGPLIAPAEGKLLRALTELGEGEEWLVKPRQLDDAGKLWRPGVKTGVLPGSQFHLTEYFGPVLGVMAADSLEQALEWQNGTDFGLTGGIHSLNDEEVERWLESVEVGNAYVNRNTTGARVRRQPFGGWKHSSVGPGAKAGGPGYVAALGRWEQAGEPTLLGEIGPRVGRFLDAVAPWLEEKERNWLRTAARSDAHSREFYRTPVDWTGLRSEINMFRYRPGPRITIRAGENTRLVELLRLISASLTAGVEAGVSVAPAVFNTLPREVRTQWENLGAELEEVTEGPAAATDGVPAGVDLAGSALGVVAGWRVETTAEFTTRASTWVQPGRVRCADEHEVAAIAEAVSTGVAVLPGPVLQSGRREMLALLREQSVSRTQHRFGHVRTIGVPEERNPEVSA